MKIVRFNKKELARLNQIDVKSGSSVNGYQQLIIAFKKKMNKQGEIFLTDDDIEHIPRYAFAYNREDWAEDLLTVFRRHLGADIGKSRFCHGYEHHTVDD